MRLETITTLLLCLLSLHWADAKGRRTCREKTIKKQSCKLSQEMEDRVNNVLQTVKTSYNEVEEQASPEDLTTMDSLLLRVGDLLFQDGRGFSDLKLAGLKLTDLGLTDVQKIQIYLVELDATITELHRAERMGEKLGTVRHGGDNNDVVKHLKKQLPLIHEHLSTIHKKATEMTKRLQREWSKCSTTSGNADVDGLIKDYTTQIESAQPTMEKDTREDSVSPPPIHRRARSASRDAERMIKHSHWVLHELQNLLQHDVLATLSNMKSVHNCRKKGKGRRKQ